MSKIQCARSPRGWECNESAHAPSKILSKMCACTTCSSLEKRYLASYLFKSPSHCYYLYTHRKRITYAVLCSCMTLVKGVWMCAWRRNSGDLGPAVLWGGVAWFSLKIQCHCSILCRWPGIWTFHLGVGTRQAPPVVRRDGCHAAHALKILVSSNSWLVNVSVREATAAASRWTTTTTITTTTSAAPSAPRALPAPLATTTTTTHRVTTRTCTHPPFKSQPKCSLAPWRQSLPWTQSAKRSHDVKVSVDLSKSIAIITDGRYWLIQDGGRDLARYEATLFDWDAIAITREEDDVK